MQPADFKRALEDKTIYREGSCFYVMKSHDCGSLSLPSGRLLVCDPWHVADAEPLAETVAPGDYPVTLATCLQDVAQPRLAVVVRFSGEEPVRWDAAKNVGGAGAIVAVDSATLLLIDSGCAAALRQQWHGDREKKRAWVEGLVAHVADAYTLAVNDPCSTGERVVMISLESDGGYPCYFGLDATGSLAALLVDLLYLDPGQLTPWSFPAPYQQPPSRYTSAFFDWLRRVGEIAGEPLVTEGPCDDALAAYFEELAERAAPPDIKLLYEHCKPTTAPNDEARSVWKAWRDKLTTDGRAIFPLQFDEDSCTYARLSRDGSAYDVRDSDGYHYGPEVWSYYVSFVLTVYLS